MEENKLINDLEFSEYLELERTSSSDLMKIAKDPALYHYSKMFKMLETSSMNFGKKLHLALLEEDKFSDLEIAKTATSTRKGLIGKTEHQYITEIKRIVFNNHFLKNIFKDSYRESSILWQYEKIELKSRLDLIKINDAKTSAIILDVKTTCANNISDICKSINDYNYMIQSQTYIKALKTVFPELQEIFFYFLFCTKQPPFHIFVYQTDTSVDDQFEYAIQQFKDLPSLDQTNQIHFFNQEDFDDY